MRFLIPFRHSPNNDDIRNDHRHSGGRGLHWLALKMVAVWARAGWQLIETFARPKHLPGIPSELEGAGLPGSVAQSISSGCAFEEALEQQGKMRAAGACLVTINSAEYPPCCAKSTIRRWCFTREGRSGFCNVPCSRGRHAPPTPYGMAVAERLSPTSRGRAGHRQRMARGIDTASHKARYR